MASNRWTTYAGRVAVIVAGLASIATSPARWNVRAPTPPAASSAPAGKALLVTVEASHQPSYQIEQPNHTLRRPQASPASSWGGRQEITVPGGYSLTNLTITGICSGGCFDKCVPPPGAFVRVASADTIGMWERSVDSPPITTTLSAPADSASQELVVEADGVVDIEVIATSPTTSFERPFVLFSAPPDAGPSTFGFAVHWYGAGSAPPPSPAAVTWFVRIRQYGFCRDATAPCAPEAGVAPPRVMVK